MPDYIWLRPQVLYADRFRADEVFAYLAQLGYRYLPRADQDRVLYVALVPAIRSERIRPEFAYNLESVLDVFTFGRPSNPDVVIQVVVVVHSVIDAVLDFHCTAVMNFITYRAGYSLYPRNTFVTMSGVAFDDDAMNGPSSKYRRRGYDLRCAMEERNFDLLGREVTRGERYVGDSHTWVINFDNGADEQLDTMLFHSWALRWTVVGRIRIQPKIIRHFYVDGYDTLITRVFATELLLHDFTDRVTSIHIDTIGRTDADVLQAVIRSGLPSLFTDMPPSAADTRFITNIAKVPVAVGGIHQLALRSFGPVDLLPSAFTEKVPNAFDDEDDIVCVNKVARDGPVAKRRRID
ncbi:hypothetical protein EV122DRAFT_227118 [Schizophyllum commune]